jgi:transcriptional regulator with XRE-family HTH domain
LANSSPRKQHCDHHGNLFTQAKLAKVTGLSEIVIGNLERGTKEHLEADILLKLADAFKLTTQERKEFLLAASNVAQAQFFHTEDLVQKVFGTLLPILEQLPTPAYLCDCFGDLIEKPLLKIRLPLMRMQTCIKSQYSRTPACWYSINCYPPAA